MYVRRASAAKATNDSGTSLQGRNAAASCKPIYTEITCVVPSAFLRKQQSGYRFLILKALMMPAQHFEPGDFTFHNRFSQAAYQEVICGEEREVLSNESIIDHAQQSRYSILVVIIFDQHQQLKYSTQMMTYQKDCKIYYIFANVHFRVALIILKKIYSLTRQYLYKYIQQNDVFKWSNHNFEVFKNQIYGY
ncbi:Hypothetical_protein [Hexamita inflata]|uniref:Hypothetical_protein n=1 Tax=Hexamita inflata TaxID=28002 RepID=A0AA86PY84_9EUKA|nr:Hypothetical protein HINF_LOCUS33623 [Hexamita inflata]